ncbi:helix-turn-helix domain-containing protein [Streptomyces sp. BBFR51]|uniref:helix-turn-helix domain-containing protein n=1 Tax=Streptomyces sp. BBFR51 TaxID=3372856 RepID=UPI0037DC674B
MSRTVSRCARERTPLLLHGETGTGKATLVRAAHALTGSASAPVVVDAAGPGAANVGNDLSAALLAAPTGPGRALVLRNVDAVAPEQGPAVARALDTAAARGTWVVGTLHRASGVPESLRRCFLQAAAVPALRHRLTDLPALVDCLLRRIGAGVECAPEVLPPLRRYDWPGNVRELSLVLSKAAAARRTYRIELRDLPPSLHSAGSRSLSPWEESERDTLVQAMLEADGNKLLAAQRLGISRTTIYRKMRAYGITLPGRG